MAKENASKTKIVQYYDENGLPRLAELPTNAPAEDAQYGVPLSFSLDGLGFASHFERELYQYLWDEGLRLPADFENNDSLTTIRRVLQRILKADANKIRDHVIQRGISND